MKMKLCEIVLKLKPEDEEEEALEGAEKPEDGDDEEEGGYTLAMPRGALETILKVFGGK